MSAHEKVRADYKAQVEGVGKVKISTLALSGKALGLVSTSQFIVLSQWNRQLKLEDMVLSELQGIAYERNANCVANLKINMVSFNGTNGTTLVITGYGEAMQVSDSELLSMSSSSSLKISTDSEYQNLEPELKMAVDKLNKENADKLNLSSDFVDVNINKRQLDVHTRAIELQKANEKLSYESAVQQAHAELSR